MKDHELKYVAIPLTGKLITSVDATKLGEGDFQALSNMRYELGGIKSVGGMSKINTIPLTNPKVKSAIHFKKDSPSESHVLAQAWNSGETASAVYDNTTSIPNQGDFGSAVWSDTTGSGYGRFSLAPDGCIAYCNGKESLIWGGNEYRCAGFVTADSTATTIYKDYTEKINNTLTSTTNIAAIVTPYYVYVASTRPIRGVKFYVGTANTATASAAVKYWASGAWNSVSGLSDGTSASSKTLAQTGSITFTDTLSTAKPRFFNNTYAYWYQFYFNGVSAATTVYYATIDASMQPIVDLWDGIARGIASCYVYTSTTGYADHTINVYKDDYDLYDENSYLQLTSFQTTSALYVGFTERASALSFNIARNKRNTITAAMSVSYWNGSAFATVTGLSDGTSDSGITLNKSGVVFWDAPTENAEFPTSLTANSQQFYYYKITFNAVLKRYFVGTGTINSSPNNYWLEGYSTLFKQEIAYGDSIHLSPQGETRVVDNVASDILLFTSMVWSTGSSGNTYDITGGVFIDSIYAVSVSKQINNYKFPVLWQNRLWLFNDQTKNKNSGKCSSQDTVSVWNGTDTKELFFGDDTEVTAAFSLFSRFGGSIYEQLIVTKQNATYIVDGISPNTFYSYKISSYCGCIAPETMKICDMGYEMAPGLNKHVAVWQSGSGIVIFDGNSIMIVSREIDNYFDPLKSECINSSMSGKSTAFYDEKNKEYHWLFASGTGTSLNKELIYNLVDKKWSEIDRGVGNRLQFGFPVMDSYGNKYIYGVLDTGYIERLENGTAFDGTPITSRFKLKDIALGGWMEETEIRKIKLITKAKTTTTNTAAITHYGDTSTTATETVTAVVNDTTRRIVQPIASVAWKGIFHSFDVQMITNNENIGFEPIGLGIYYKLVRPDIR